MQKALVNYFKSCYQSDYRAISLLNFYSAKVEHSLILESAELLQGKILEFPVPTNWGKKVEQRLAIYSKEKALYYCSFFMFGEMIIAEKNIVGNLVGTWSELYELMELANKGLVKLSMQEYKLDDANKALHDLNEGKVKGRAVLVP